MSENTKIEWCDATVNLVQGCTKVSPGCLNCYAARADGRNLYGKESHWGPGAPRHVFQGFRKKCIALNSKAQRLGVRLKVFPNSYSDWLDHEWPIDVLAEFLDVIRICTHLDFLTLTKRPELWWGRIYAAMHHSLPKPSRLWPDAHLTKWLRAWLDGNPPANVLLGWSVENQDQNEKRTPHGLAIPALVHFISAEPLLGYVNLMQVGADDDNTLLFPLTGEVTAETLNEPIPLKYGGIDWVICGGESGPGARAMHPDWARSLRDQCQEANVAFFMKQMGGTRKPFPAIPDDLMIREFPKGGAE